VERRRHLAESCTRALIRGNPHDKNTSQKYVAFCGKMKIKIREQSAKKIYFWWIPICYDTTRNCGKRMMVKNLEKAKELGLELCN